MSFDDKTYKAKIYVISGRNSNLFGIDWIVLFNLWGKPINTFCRNLNVSNIENSKQTEEFVEDLKDEFKDVFTDG